METPKKDGLAIAKRISDNKYNFITEDGKLLSDEWFEWVDYFHDGLAKVKRAYEEYNYINKQGKLLSNEWFRCVDDFKDGLAIVQKANREWAKIDKQGKIVSNNKSKRNGMKNPKLTYEIKGETISSELDEKTLNDILQSVLLAKPELSEYDAIKYLFYGFTPIPTNSITRFEFSFIDDMGFKCVITKSKQQK